MKIQISVKQAGKKRPTIRQKTIEIADLPADPMLQDLLSALVSQQVQEHNQKTTDDTILPFMVKEAIEEKAAAGKIGFSQLYNPNKAEENVAINNVLLAFQDGLFAVFIDEEQIVALNQSIQLNEKSIITLIRLTFLAGSYW